MNVSDSGVLTDTVYRRKQVTQEASMCKLLSQARYTQLGCISQVNEESALDKKIHGLSKILMRFQKYLIIWKS